MHYIVVDELIINIYAKKKSRMTNGHTFPPINLHNNVVRMQNGVRLMTVVKSVELDDFQTRNTLFHNAYPFKQIYSIFEYEMNATEKKYMGVHCKCISVFHSLMITQKPMSIKHS